MHFFTGSISSTNLYHEAAENNTQKIISEGFSNVFVKHPLENDFINKLKRKSQNQAPPTKKTHILEWKFLNDEKAIADHNKIVLDFKNMAISLANEGKLTYAAHPSEIFRENDKDKFEDLIEQPYYKLKVKFDDPDKKLLRKCQNVWKYLTVEDTHVHELLHPLLKPFFTIEQGCDINWANKMSMSSAE
nr:7686_t:CDS:2 [Entrophospora candida]